MTPNNKSVARMTVLTIVLLVATNSLSYKFGYANGINYQRQLVNETNAYVSDKMRTMGFCQWGELWGCPNSPLPPR